MTFRTRCQCACVLSLLGPFVWAQTPRTTQEIEELKKRVEQLEKRLAEKPAAAPAALSAWGIKPYLTVQLDTIFWSSEPVTFNRVAAGDAFNPDKAGAPAPAESAERHGRDVFTILARGTQVGLDATAPEALGAKARGKFEMDFRLSNPGGDVRVAEPRLRLAWFDLTWPGKSPSETLTLRAGQDWTVYEQIGLEMPMRPKATLDNNFGDVGHLHAARWPQIQFSRKWPELWGECTATISAMLPSDLSGQPAPVDPGNRSGRPYWAGRLSVGWPFLERKLLAGVAGHFGQEKQALGSGSRELFDTKAVQGDLRIPLPLELELQLVAWKGQNLDDFHEVTRESLGGVSGTTSGVNLGTGEAVDARGGWAQFGAKCPANIEAYIGWGTDNPSDSDLNALDIQSNRATWTSLWWKATREFTVALEYARIHTEYLQGDEGDTDRWNMSLFYRFW